MAKRDNGNEQNLTVRPGGPDLTNDNPSVGPSCEQHGHQTDLPADQPEPDTNLSLYDWTDIPGACPAGFSPQQLDILFSKLLKQHFGNASNIMNPFLRQFAWRDGAGSGIRIALNTTWDPAQAGQTPSIVIKRGPQQAERISIGDHGERLGGSDAQRSFARMITGSHRLLAVGNTDGVTEALAFEVFSLMSCVGPIIRTQLAIHNFEASGIGEVGFMDDIGKTMAVPVQIGYAYEYGWTIEETAPNLTLVRTTLIPSLS